MIEIVKPSHDRVIQETLSEDLRANYRRFGKTELEVSPLAFGGSAINNFPDSNFGGWDPGRWNNYHEDKSRATLMYMIYRRINFFDMGGASYGNCVVNGKQIHGHAESVLGDVLSIRDNHSGTTLRDRVIVCTKGGSIALPHNGGELELYTNDNLDVGLDRSLERLQTDHIDIYLLHGHPREEPEIRRVIEHMATLKDRIHHFGISIGVPAGDAGKVYSDMWRTLYGEYPFLNSIMITVNFENETAVNHVLPWTRELDIGVIAKTMLGVGRLTNRFIDEWAKDDDSEGTVRLRKVRDLLVAKGVAGTLQEAALRYALTRAETGAVATVNTTHVDEAIRNMLEGPLPEDVLDEIRVIFAGE